MQTEGGAHTEGTEGTEDTEVFWGMCAVSLIWVTGRAWRMASHRVREPGGNNGAGGGARTEGTEDTEVFWDVLCCGNLGYKPRMANGWSQRN
jgi:hypothetical protein